MTQTIETRVTVLEKEINQVTGLFGRLDTTIDKLSDVSSSIKQLLAVHETKLNQHEQTHRDVYDEIERRRKESTDQHIAIQKEIATMQTKFKQEIDELERRITEKITDLGKSIDTVSNKTNKVYDWKTMVGGGILVLIFVLNTVISLGLIPHK